jgi:hypothetical protein
MALQTNQETHTFWGVILYLNHNTHQECPTAQALFAKKCMLLTLHCFLPFVKLHTVTEFPMEIHLKK